MSIDGVALWKARGSFFIRKLGRDEKPYRAFPEPVAAALVAVAEAARAYRSSEVFNASLTPYLRQDFPGEKGQMFAALDALAEALASS